MFICPSLPLSIPLLPLRNPPLMLDPLLIRLCLLALKPFRLLCGVVLDSSTLLPLGDPAGLSRPPLGCLFEIDAVSQFFDLIANFLQGHTEELLMKIDLV